MTSMDDTHSFNILQEFLDQLEKQNDESLLQYLQLPYTLTLERWIWDLFEENSSKKINQTNTIAFIQRLAKFNKRMIFISMDLIDTELKANLLLPKSIEQIDRIFNHIRQCNNEQSTYLSLVALSIDNLSYFLHEYPSYNSSALIVRINENINEQCVMTEQFRTYLTQLNLSNVPSSIFTTKFMFYIKSCSLSLNVYFYSKPEKFPRTTEHMIEVLRDDYVQTVIRHSFTIETWSDELLSCLTHLIGFLRSLVWWEGEKGMKLKFLFPNETFLFEYISALVRIFGYRPFYQHLVNQWSNDQTVLIDSTILFLMNIIYTQDVNWYCQTIENLPSILLRLASLPVYYRIYLCAYGVLSEILTDDNLKTLKISNKMRTFFYNVLVQAWESPNKKFKQIPIDYLLKGFVQLAKSDFIQQQTAEMNRIGLLIEISDEYPIAYDIIWALSFNAQIQDQLRENTAFLTKLKDLSQETNDESTVKIINGILWNLQINHENQSYLSRSQEASWQFDIMISYSHKDKQLCHQLYDELIKQGYRIWIDFDQMHGNVIDAMAQAIEQSHMVIICMSEDYRRSNYCRAEAQYAFQRQRKMVPVLFQKHYRPDGWLSFLIGHLFYIDFTKYEFVEAMELLLKQLQAHTNTICSSNNDEVKETVTAEPNIPSGNQGLNMVDWSSEHVQEWLIKHDLSQMSRLLKNCDGRSLMYLHRYLKHSDKTDMVALLSEDVKRRLNERLSLIELSRFQSLIDRERHVNASSTSKIGSDL